MIRARMRGVTLVAVGLFHCGLTAATPVKVFILAGQSNMVGEASLEHLVELTNEPPPNKYREKLWNETDGDFKKRDDVFFKFGDREGMLSPFGGLGDPYYGDRFGPELMFGWKIGDAFDKETVYLIKTAWGGKTLAVDFRPPSSGPGDYGGHKKYEYGQFYRKMMRDYHNAIGAIGSVIPNYDKDKGYDLAGLVWFQGWNDVLFMPMVKEYQKNLANFIRDVRVDLNAPYLPVVIGELGQHGVNVHIEKKGAVERVMKLRASQQMVTMQDEFRNNTAYVETAKFVVSNGTQYEKRYHYFGRADTYCNIGEAFAEAMLGLLKT